MREEPHSVFLWCSVQSAMHLISRAWLGVLWAVFVWGGFEPGAYEFVYTRACFLSNYFLCLFTSFPSSTASSHTVLDAKIKNKTKL